MSETNVNLLESAGYKYILGARIRSESPKVKKWLLDIDREDGHCAEYVERAGRRLIVSYSEARAMKNAQTHRSTYLYLLRSIQGIQGVGAYTSNYGNRNEC